MRTGGRCGQRFQPFERKRQMRAAFVVGHGVNFVDDDGLDIAQNGAAFFGGKQDVKRLGRGDQNVRRPLQHGAALVHERVAGADGGADLGHQQAALAGHLQNFAQRDFEILLDVVAEGFERRDVEDFGAVLQVSGQGLANQAIDAGEKRGQRLAGAGGGRDQRGAAGKDVRPALFLRFCGRSESAGRTIPAATGGPRRGCWGLQETFLVFYRDLLVS